VAHDEAAAAEALESGLAELGLSPKRVGQMPKSAPEKMVLAWWLRRIATVSLRWLSRASGNGALYAGEPGDQPGATAAGALP
jgi:hypothetical protein